MGKKCKICTTFKLKKLERLNKDIRKGNKSLKKLAVKYGTKTSLLSEHLNCVKEEEQDGYALLKELLNRVNKDIKTARSEAFYGDEDTARGAAILYTNLLREAREIVNSLEKVRPKKDLVDRINEAVVTALIQKIVEILIEEGSSFRSEMQLLLGSDYNSTVDKTIKARFNTIADRIGDQYKRSYKVLKTIVLEKDTKKSLRSSAKV